MHKKLWSILIASTFLLTANLMADEHVTKPKGYHWQQIPAVCGDETMVLKDLAEQGFVPVNMSLGRANSDPQGEPVFLVTYFLQQDMSGTAATITIPTSNDACILYITHDLTFTSPE